ncbi:MAG: hypothetical protein QXU45_09100 [Candidatus Bathyarchaeia archaeon]
MKMTKKERNLLIVLLFIVAAVVAFLFVPADAAATWRAKASGNGLTINVSGRTELLGAGGNTIQLRFLAKMAMLPLEFVYQGQAVQGLRVHFSYTIEGDDVDWNTLVVTASASGTGGFSQSKTFTSRTGSHIFTLPISAIQLGRQPSEGEEMAWTLTVTLRAEARATQGAPLSVEARPITSSVTTVWKDGALQPETTPSTQVPEETGGGTTTVGGGCGPPGHHLVWVAGVEPVSFLEEYGWQMAVVAAEFGLAAGASYALGRLNKRKEDA